MRPHMRFGFEEIAALAEMLDPTGEGTRKTLQEVENDSETLGLDEEEKRLALQMLRELLKHLENRLIEREQ